MTSSKDKKDGVDAGYKPQPFLAMKKVPEPTQFILSPPLEQARESNKESFLAKLSSALNWFSSPRTILAPIWFLCALQLFFAVDFLKLTPSNLYLFTNGKLRQNNIDPYLPQSVARDPTLFDLFSARDPLPHLDKHE